MLFLVGRWRLAEKSSRVQNDGAAIWSDFIARLQNFLLAHLEELSK